MLHVGMDYMVQTLNKQILIEALEAQCNLDRTHAQEIVHRFFNDIKDALISGKKVKLANFGTFEVRYKKARPGLNLKTGEKAEISARYVVVFKIAESIRKRVERELLSDL